jgi:hypothetical protein
MFLINTSVPRDFNPNRLTSLGRLRSCCFLLRRSCSVKTLLCRKVAISAANKHLNPFAVLRVKSRLMLKLALSRSARLSRVQPAASFTFRGANWRPHRAETLGLPPHLAKLLGAFPICCPYGDHAGCTIRLDGPMPGPHPLELHVPASAEPHNSHTFGFEASQFL